jgi:hypothetical protein
MIRERVTWSVTVLILVVLVLVNMAAVRQADLTASFARMSESSVSKVAAEALDTAYASTGRRVDLGAVEPVRGGKDLTFPLVVAVINSQGCGTCEEDEMSFLDSLHGRFGADRAAVVFSTPDREFVDGMVARLTVANVFWDKSGNAARAWGVATSPWVAVVNANGAVALGHTPVAGKPMWSDGFRRSLIRCLEAEIPSACLTTEVQ